jgi:hypothetical protein
MGRTSRPSPAALQRRAPSYTNVSPSDITFLVSDMLAAQQRGLEPARETPHTECRV